MQHIELPNIHSVVFWKTVATICITFISILATIFIHFIYKFSDMKRKVEEVDKHLSDLENILSNIHESLHIIEQKIDNLAANISQNMNMFMQTSVLRYLDELRKSMGYHNE